MCSQVSGLSPLSVSSPKQIPVIWPVMEINCWILNTAIIMGDYGWVCVCVSVTNHGPQRWVDAHAWLDCCVLTLFFPGALCCCVLPWHMSFVVPCVIVQLGCVSSGCVSCIVSVCVPDSATVHPTVCKWFHVCASVFLHVHVQDWCVQRWEAKVIVNWVCRARLSCWIWLIWQPRTWRDGSVGLWHPPTM